jgi:pSer/pThr/pTyr-binding forkhead associated (FHA) protein
MQSVFVYPVYYFVCRLTSEVTRFGRHSGNDYFLDSTETLLLVSRWHAEIHRTVNDGSVQYVIRDGSLNGTYVNDVRVTFA